MHLWPKLTAKIKVGDGFVLFNKEATRWLGVWMDAHLTFKKHHNRCMKKARAAEARLRVLTRMHGIVSERVWAVQIACVQAVALYGSELWWDPKEIGRREDLQLLLDREARSTLGALPTTTLGPLMRDSSPRLQAATICGEARKRMRRLQAKGDVQPPHVWRTDMQSHQETARTRPGGRDDALAPPGRRTRSEDGHTER